MRFNFWEMSLTKRTILIVILLGLLVEAIYLPVTIRALLVSTDYAPGFDKRAFREVKSGDSWKKVLVSLGSPLNYRVVSLKQDDAGHVIECSQRMETLLHWATNQSVLIYFEYSRPKRSKGNFEAWEVLLRGGVVTEKKQYTYWD